MKQLFMAIGVFSTVLFIGVGVIVAHDVIILKAQCKGIKDKEALSKCVKEEQKVNKDIWIKE